ncbi:MAG: FG-GAP-like repeat-containing protein [Candidatus Electryonea clarkiae]|nr:FG-GAP-like repeat-containing protein [Candidatus Electryonea clarkiae]MDP8286088.1 FG-GAP-like repeat-containing protein [Candidatus Electryonea clarkiae]
MYKQIKMDCIAGVIILLLFSNVYAEFTEVTQEALGAAPNAISAGEMGAWPDYNNDGWADLHLGADRLYENNQDGTFTLVNDIGLDTDGGVAYRSTWADVDNDGDLDCVQGLDRQNLPNQMYYSYYYENSGNPDYIFTRTNIYRPPLYARNCQPMFVDGDGDGVYELYQATFGNWDPYGRAADKYFSWQGGRNWSDVTDFCLPELSTFMYERHTRGVVACDYDNDFDMDIFVPVYPIQWFPPDGNDASWLNILWQNDGTGDFSDVAEDAGVAIETHGRYGYGLASGASWGDYDNDGWFDLVVGNIHGLCALYRNNQNGTFEHVTLDVGLPPALPERQWHNTLWSDYDNDGDLDLFACQWYENYRAYLFRNNGPDSTNYFTDVTNLQGFSTIREFDQVSGFATADYDLDGDMDVYFSGGLLNNRGKHLFSNDLDEETRNNHWLIAEIEGDGESCGLTALGTKIRIRYDDGWSCVMQVEATSADLSMNMHPVHFGLGQHERFEEIVVYWQCGYVESFGWDQFEGVDQYVTLVEGNGTEYDEVRESRPITLPSEIILHPAMPNPFNSIAKIKVTLPTEKDFTLSVYDIQGRLVSTLHSGILSQGNHLFVFNSDKLPSGIYFINLQSATGINTEKVVLLK